MNLSRRPRGGYTRLEASRSYDDSHDDDQESGRLAVVLRYVTNTDVMLVPFPHLRLVLSTMWLCMASMQLGLSIVTVAKNASNSPNLRWYWFGVLDLTRVLLITGVRVVWELKAFKRVFGYAIMRSPTSASRPSLPTAHQVPSHAEHSCRRLLLWLHCAGVLQCTLGLLVFYYNTSPTHGGAGLHPAVTLALVFTFVHMALNVPLVMCVIQLFLGHRPQLSLYTPPANAEELRAALQQPLPQQQAPPHPPAPSAPPPGQELPPFLMDEDALIAAATAASLRDLELSESRQLRSQQDQEYQEALDRDLRQQEDATLQQQRLHQLHEDRMHNAQLLQSEPAEGDEDTLSIRARLPNGVYVTRRFPCSAPMSQLFAWIGSQPLTRSSGSGDHSHDEELSPQDYRIVHNFPRKLFLPSRAQDHQALLTAFGASHGRVQVYVESLVE